ncbi:MAG: hypothetical protein OEM24_07015 [Paracoccaceae bacterium]|nr:hypothetical protein [Paracoccaceae bacterium]
MKPVVLASLEDADGRRCVDILRTGEAACGWRECRRDPEDGTGWRSVGGERGSFGSEADARADAGHAVAWLEAAP